MFLIKSSLNVNIYLKCFHFTSCLLGYNIKRSNFLNVKNSVVCAEFPVSLKCFFPQWETYFFPIRCTSDFFPILQRVGKMGFFEVPLISYFVKLWGEFFKHSLFAGEKGTHFMINVFKEKNVHIYITSLCKFKWR